MHRRVISTMASMVVAATTFVVLGPAGVATANDVIAPTTTADVVSPDDDLLSLREAVVLANSTAGADTIQLAAGQTYVLDLGCHDSGQVLPGELHVTDPAGLTVEGGDATITQSSGPGYFCDRRLFHSDAGPLTLRAVTLSGGEAVVHCDMHASCPPLGEQGFGGAVRATGPVVLDGVHVTGNQADRRGGGVSSESTVTVVDSTLVGNASGRGGAIHASGAVTIERTTIEGNRAHHWVETYGVYGGSGGGVSSQTSVTVRQSLVAENSAEALGANGSCYAARGGGLAAPSITVASSTIVDNVVEVADFLPCPTGSVVGVGGGLSGNQVVLGGVVFDRPSHRFRSTDPLTRGDAVLLVWRLMGSPPPAPGPLDFVDVPRTASYRRALKWAIQGDLLVPVSGRFGRRFDAGQPFTRDQFVRLLWSVAGRPEDAAAHHFTDVGGNFATWLDWAADRDVLPSTTGAFRPDRPMRRAAAVVVVHRAASNPAAWTAAEPPPTNDF